eukprot:scaffold217934_cov42-Prasinocladus_malaysianus.AAC.1
MLAACVWGHSEQLHGWPQTQSAAGSLIRCTKISVLADRPSGKRVTSFQAPGPAKLRGETLWVTNSVPRERRLRAS